MAVGYGVLYQMARKHAIERVIDRYVIRSIVRFFPKYQMGKKINEYEILNWFNTRATLVLHPFMVHRHRS